MMKAAHGEQLNGRNLNRFDEDTLIRVSFFMERSLLWKLEHQLCK